MMNVDYQQRLAAIQDIAERFDLRSLEPALRACQALSKSESIDLAVLGQFKSGKSSLINAVIGEAILPVGVLPVTAVVTRLASGPRRTVKVTHFSGAVTQTEIAQLDEFVTEKQNPGNEKQVALVEVFTPALHQFGALRLVDTPGLGSVLAHNTATTRDWMPNVAAAIVSVSAERPLSEQDVELIREARQTAPRVLILLTKVDLLTDAERGEVTAFLERTIEDMLQASIPILPFSTRTNVEQWTDRLQESLLRPLAANVPQEREKALALKLDSIARACRSYLEIGQASAEQIDTNRDQLRAAILNETVSAEVIHDEFKLAERAVRNSARPAFERYFLSCRASIERQLHDALIADVSTWSGNLAVQKHRYEIWIKERLTSELTPLSTAAAAEANRLVDQVEKRLRRIAEAFRDRLSRNVHQAMGVTISSVAWEAKRPMLMEVPISIGTTFMTNWDILWWLLPMKLIGGLFRRHLLNQVSREVEKNLYRLVSDWSEAVGMAITGLSAQATNWVDAERQALDRLLTQAPSESPTFREAIRKLDRSCQPQSV